MLIPDLERLRYPKKMYCKNFGHEEYAWKVNECLFRGSLKLKVLSTAKPSLIEL